MLVCLILVWDHMQYVSFKWIHFEVNTLAAYNDEIMFENSLMLNQTGKFLSCFIFFLSQNTLLELDLIF